MKLNKNSYKVETVVRNVIVRNSMQPFANLAICNKDVIEEKFMFAIKIEKRFKETEILKIKKQHYLV